MIYERLREEFTTGCRSQKSCTACPCFNTYDAECLPQSNEKLVQAYSKMFPDKSDTVLYLHALLKLRDKAKTEYEEAKCCLRAVEAELRRVENDEA